MEGELARVAAISGKESPPGIALFDLDGTLLPWDCQLIFRSFVVKREPWRGGFLPIFLACVPFAGVIGTQGMKRVFLCYLWRIDPGKLAEYSREFAKTVVMPMIYPEIRAKLDRQREAGHLAVLTSASPAFYVSEIGRELGFDVVMGTPVKTGPFFPPLENNKSVVKVRRLKEELPAGCFDREGKLVNSHGYTDSTADLPMLELCGSATVVNPKARLTALAEEKGWEIVRPGRPWKSKAGFAWKVMGLLFGWGSCGGGR